MILQYHVPYALQFTEDYDPLQSTEDFLLKRKKDKRTANGITNIIKVAPELKDELLKSLKLHEVEARNALSEEEKKSTWTNGPWHLDMINAELREAIMVQDRRIEELRRKFFVCCRALLLLNRCAKRDERRSKYAARRASVV